MVKIASDNLIFTSKYPTLEPAAKQKAVSVYFHVLFQLPSDIKYLNTRKEIKSKICNIRWSVLKDKNCIKKTRIALILSYLGFNFTKKVFIIIKKINITF